jgi:hypothetical protein
MDYEERSNSDKGPKTKLKENVPFSPKGEVWWRICYSGGY